MNPPPTCPNGKCDAGETAATCPADCKMPGTCGNGKCDPGEEQTCAGDCCGDGRCSRLERFFCVADCGTTCGDSTCQITDLFLCPAECDASGLPLPIGAGGDPALPPAP